MELTMAISHERFSSTIDRFYRDDMQKMMTTMCGLYNIDHEKELFVNVYFKKKDGSVADVFENNGNTYIPATGTHYVPYSLIKDCKEGDIVRISYPVLSHCEKREYDFLLIECKLEGDRYWGSLTDFQIALQEVVKKHFDEKDKYPKSK